MKKNLIIIGITAFIIAAMWLSSPLYRAKDSLYVSTVSPQKKDIYDSVISRGSVEASESKEIYLSTPSMINEVYVEIGDYVEEGDVLLEVDPTNKMIDIGIVSSIIPELSDVEINTIETLMENYKIDAAEYLQAINVFNDSQTSQEPIVASPMQGVVTQLNAIKGKACSSYKAAVVVSDLENMHVRIQVPELYIDRIKEGQEVEITGDAFSKKYRGAVEKIYPTAIQKNTITGVGETVVDTIVSISNPDSLLKPGYSVTAKIYTQKKTDVFTLPYSCILQEGNREYVYIADRGIAIKRHINTGLELDDEVEITYGLKGKEKIIVSPPEKMSDGSPVEEMEK